MSNEKVKVPVSIYGTQYRLMGGPGNSTTHLRMVAAQVDEQMRQIAQGQPHLDMPRIAVLTAVNFADEVIKLKEAHQAHQQDLAAHKDRNDRLQQETVTAKEQLAEERKQKEQLQQELQQLREEHRDLQKQYHQELSRSMHEDSKDDELLEQYNQLKEEYRKLQTEYNEWIQLIEHNDPEA